MVYMLRDMNCWVLSIIFKREVCGILGINDEIKLNLNEVYEVLSLLGKEELNEIWIKIVYILSWICVCLGDLFVKVV